MKAAIQLEHNAPVVTSDVETPLPRQSEVLVRILASGLNHLDLWLRQGNTGDNLSLPRIPGTDVLGVVEAVGLDVNDMVVGSRVLIYPGQSCGDCEHCENENESACRQFEILGYHVDGGYAEYISVPEKSLVPLTDDNLSWAAVPVSYITAWNALVSKGRLQAGQSIVIWGAAGGLGNAALRISLALGARPIAIVGDQDKKDWLRSTGFHGPVILRNGDILQEIRDNTEKRGVDMVLDHVGAYTFNDSLKMLATGGHLAFCGITSGYLAQIDLRRIFGRQLTIAGTWMGNYTDLRAVVDLLHQHPEALPTITAQFDLEAAATAQDEIADPGRIGKVLLNIGRDLKQEEPA